MSAMTKNLKPGDLGWSLFPDRNPMLTRCVDCPFTAAENGRDYLAKGRLDDIKFSISLGQPFYCHKTVQKTRSDEENPVWHPDWRMCKGAIDFVIKGKADVDDR